MIRRNVANQRITLPELRDDDGLPVTTGATLTIRKDTGAYTAPAGTLTHVAKGVWEYTPTDAETDAAIVALILTATNAGSVVLNLVTTGADTSAVALGANTVTPPTVAEFEARTLPSDDYFVVGDYTEPTNLSAAQVRSELSVELGRIDAAISTRSQHSATNVAALILATPANLLATDGDGRVTTANPATEGGEIIVNPTQLSSGSIEGIRDGLALAAELDKVIKTGEERTYSRSGVDPITFTETRAT